MVPCYLIIRMTCPVPDYTDIYPLSDGKFWPVVTLKSSPKTLADVVTMEEILSITVREKTLSEKDKLLVTSNFSYSLNVFLNLCGSNFGQ